MGVAQTSAFVPPKTVWLPAAKGKGLEISGTFARRNSQIYMELTVTNRAMQPMGSFAIQFNKNSFGLTPAATLIVPTPLSGGKGVATSLPINTNGTVQKSTPITNLQVAIKNNIDVFYFSCTVPMNVLFMEDGEMDRKVFLATWKDIPATNEVESKLPHGHHLNNGDGIMQILQNNNIFTIAKREVDGQELLYQSLRFTNGIWVLAELKMTPDNVLLVLKTKAMDVIPGVEDVYASIIHQA